jgi:hypothetical protein
MIGDLTIKNGDLTIKISPNGDLTIKNADLI